MITDEQYQVLRSKAEKLRRQAEKAEGSLETLKKRLKDEFGLDTLEAASAKIKELSESVVKAEQTYTEKLAAFEEEWGERLNSVK